MIFHDCIAKNKDNACQIARLHSLMWWFHVKVSIEPDFIVNVYSRYMYNVDRQINGCHNVISIDVKIYNTSVVHISKNYIYIYIYGNNTRNKPYLSKYILSSRY